MMNWQPIETAPEGITVMLTDGDVFGFNDVSYHPDGGIVTCPASAAFDGSDKWDIGGERESQPRYFYPTRWRPLPKPPSD
jgi:hypothetical protein